jgi:NitT/TauT family transport system substrate-binding protein
MRDPHVGRLSCLSISVLLLSLSVSGVVAAEPLRIRYAVWVGCGPLFLAQQKGYFRAEKAEVQLIRMEDPKESFAAMAAGRLDGIVSTIDTMIPHLKTGREFQYVLALDDSAGGDGIVARKEIKSVRDLRGRRVAVQEGSVSQFFLNVLLRDAGLSEKDVQVVNMKPGDAGAAFAARRVDAAVTWEPWLSTGRTAPHGHMLVDSSQTPGLISDVLVFRRDVVERRPREIQGVVDAWNKAVAYWEKNPAESNEIMARRSEIGSRTRGSSATC